MNPALTSPGQVFGLDWAAPFALLGEATWPVRQAGLAVVAIPWLAAVATARASDRVDRRAVVLLAPPSARVTFAVFLNYRLWHSN